MPRGWEGVPVEGGRLGSVIPESSCGISIAERFRARVLESDSNLTSHGLHFHIYVVEFKGSTDLTGGCKKWMSSCK